jgi:hypothetical protein
MMVFTLGGCKEDPDPSKPETGRIKLFFAHTVDGDPLVIDTLKYTNAAGNRYLVNEVQYFISDVTLYKSDGTVKLIDDWKDIHYVDSDIPSTMSWEVYDSIPAGSFDSISFIFGISEEKNQSMMYTDPPESLMFWPEFLGGGYHYLKLNGKWLDTLNLLSPFDFHIGIGQIRNEEGNITGFVQNYFRVSLPNSFFQVEKEKITGIVITMRIDSWFGSPHDYDLNYWGGAIMENQAAMQMAKENGYDVFSASVMTEN